MKKNLFTKAVLLSLAAIVSMSVLAACGSSTPEAGSETASAGEAGADASTAPEATDETLKVMVASEPQSLTSLTGLNDQVAVELQYAMAARVWEFNNETYELEMSLATGWEEIDETHYRIELRDDAKFRDGTPVTSEDVVYCYQAYCEAGLDGSATIDPEGFVIEDDTHFIIAFSTYTPGWYNALAEATFGIYSKAFIEENGGVAEFERVQPMTAGRYFVNEWKPGEYLLLERNDNYWDPEYVGYYKYIQVSWTSDSASRILAVKSGDVDVTEKISVSEAITLDADPSATPVYFESGTVFNFYFNCSSDGPVGNEKVREALMYAINSEEINALVNMGRGKAVQGMYPDNGVYYKEYYPGGIHPYDEAKAKELLAEAGYPDGFTIEAVVLKNNIQPATAIQEMFRKVGVEMNITSLEPASYLPEARAGNYDTTIGSATNTYLKPDNFNLLSCEDRFSVIGGPKISDPAIDEITGRAKSSDPAVAEQGWYDAIDYIFDHTALVGLYNKIECAAINPALDGLKSIKRDYLDFTEIRPIQ